MIRKVCGNHVAEFRVGRVDAVHQITNRRWAVDVGRHFARFRPQSVGGPHSGHCGDTWLNTFFFGESLSLKSDCQNINRGRLRSRSRKSCDTSGIAACAEYQSARRRKPGRLDSENTRPRPVAHWKASAEPSVNQYSHSSSKHRLLGPEPNS